MAETIIRKDYIRKSKRRDRMARYVITIGGVAVIISVVLILVMIAAETLPLFGRSEKALLVHRELQTIGSGAAGAAGNTAPVIALGVDMSMDEKLLTAYTVHPDGSFVFYDLREDKELSRTRVSPPGGGEGRIRAVEPFDSNSFSVLWESGAASLARANLTTEYGKDQRRDIRCKVDMVAEIESVAKTPAVAAIVRRSEEGDVTCAALLEDGNICVTKQVKEEAGLFGDAELKTESYTLDAPEGAALTTLTMDRRGRQLYAGTETGELLAWRLGESAEATDLQRVQAFTDKRAITAVAMVFGDFALAVGDAHGGLGAWFPVRKDEDSPRRLQLVHRLKSHSSQVAQIVASQRSRCLLSLDAKGIASLDYTTSERHLLEFAAVNPIRLVAYGPRGNCMIGVDDTREIRVWRIRAPHPEVSVQTLFGKVHYEGYDKAEYVWQSTGGEDFESKLSMVPLLFGTFKSTFYAMLFAVPLALFAAVYTSQFTTPEFKGVIKPVVEIMAAVPSVVVGFLAAMWLAPIVSDWIVSVFVGLVAIPLAFAAFMLLWQACRKQDWAKRIERGYEFLAVVPALIVGVLLAIVLQGPAEQFLFDGNFKLWLADVLRSYYYSPEDFTLARYDPRNCIIISIALGFAVIPIIFSIAEDSLSNVPQALSAGSLALGASRWQTVWRVILPSASPGIFAAIMIGFGRAIGETMIVLMAAGGTPILDMSPFNGMRTLTVSIANEIPEAPVGGTLYRVLFFCAVLLFSLTFILNTAAELVRHHLRKKYGRF